MGNVGEVIKERRLAKGMSKRALAEKAGISHSEVHRIENGGCIGHSPGRHSYARRVQDWRGEHPAD